MPPKKPVKEDQIILGRPGNSLKSGIVSLRFSQSDRQHVFSARGLTLSTQGWACERWQVDFISSYHEV